MKFAIYSKSGSSSSKWHYNYNYNKLGHDNNFPALHIFHGLLSRNSYCLYSTSVPFMRLSLYTCRQIAGIRGLTRETVITLTTSIESREQKRVYNIRCGYPAEHPRAATTDDVECFFSVVHDTVGSHFTLKDVQFAFRKCCNEFCKLLSPDLSFWYYTSSHDRFYDGMRPEFSETQGRSRSSRNPRNQRVREYEQPAGVLMSRRATLPQPGARSTRMTYHNLPRELPPLQHTLLTEHSYSKI